TTVALVGDGGFGAANPMVMATAMEADLPVIWVVMDNMAFGTIAGLEAQTYDWSFGCTFECGGKPYRVDFAAMARACRVSGVLVDSWGGRRLLILGSIAAAIGTFLFGTTSSFVVASMGRALVGGATAVGWIVTLKLATHWFPSQRFALMSGLGLFMGNMGALV